MTENNSQKGTLIDSMFAVGAHYACPKSRRHSSTKPYIFGIKNKVEIFDLEKTEMLLNEAKAFVATIAKEGKQILFVGGKSEAKDAVKEGAISINMPYVAGRWIGGALTNYPEIRKRIEKFEDLTSKKEKGELAKYTKKERLMIDKEISDLDSMFYGLLPMRQMPAALFVVDSKKEEIAILEAKRQKIPVISLSNSDCNIKLVDYPITGNDASAPSIKFFVQEIVDCYKKNKVERASPSVVPFKK